LNVVLDNFDLFWLGFVSTLHLLTVSGIGALVLGTLMVSLRVSPFGSFRALSAIYTEILRNTPLTHRGRDAHYWAPPAQIPAGVIHAPGSYLG